MRFYLFFFGIDFSHMTRWWHLFCVNFLKSICYSRWIFMNWIHICVKTLFWSHCLFGSQRSTKLSIFSSPKSSVGSTNSCFFGEESLHKSELSIRVSWKCVPSCLISKFSISILVSKDIRVFLRPVFHFLNINLVLLKIKVIAKYELGEEVSWKSVFFNDILFSNEIRVFSKARFSIFDINLKFHSLTGAPERNSSWQGQSFFSYFVTTKKAKLYK